MCFDLTLIELLVSGWKKYELLVEFVYVLAMSQFLLLVLASIANRSLVVEAMSGDCMCFLITNLVDGIREISLIIIDALMCFALVFEWAERDCQTVY